MKKKNKSLKKKLMFGTAIAATSVIIGGSTLTPEDDYAGHLSQNEEVTTILSTASKTIAPIEIPLYQKVLNKLPKVFRILFVVPLCLLFHLLLNTLFHLLLRFFSPLLSSFIYWILFIFINLIVILLSVKMMYPDKPVREILNRKCILNVITGSILIYICDKLFTLNYPDAIEIQETIPFIGSMILDVKEVLPYIKSFRTPQRIVRIQMPEEYNDIDI